MSKSSKPVKVKNLSLDKRMAKHGWVFISPLVIGFVVFYADMLLQSLRYAFSEVTPGDSMVNLEFVGLTHFHRALFVENDFVRNVVQSAWQTLYSVPLVIIFSLFVATLLNRKLPGRSLFRAIFFIPAVLVTGAIAASTSGNALSNAMNEMGGIATGAVSDTFQLEDLQSLFGSAVLNDSLFSYILGAINNIFNVIKQCGVQILIFISGLQAINPSVYEAASIEGANGWDCYWKITFPLIGPMILVNAVYTVVDSFTASGNRIMTMVNDLGVAHIGYASAIAWMYFVLILLVLLIVVAFLKLTVLRSTR